MIFAIAVAWYGLSLAPDVTWGGGDSPRLAIWVHDLTLGTHPTSHPLYVLAGRLWTALVPLGNLAFRLNLLSAVAGGAALLLFYRICRHLHGDRFLAVVACIALGVSHTFWTLSVITEVYTFDLLIILALLWWSLRWMEQPSSERGALICFAFGLGLVEHLMIALMGPALLIALIKGSARGRFRLTLPRAALGILAFLAGLSPSLWIMIVSLPKGAGIGELWQSVEVFLNVAALDTATPAQAADLADLLRFQWSPLLEIVLLIGLNFAGVAGVAGALGVARALAARSAKFAVLLVAMGCFYLFALLHPQVDTFQFCLAGHVVFALLLPLGFETLRGWIGHRTRFSKAALDRCLVLLILAVPPLVYAGLPALAKSAGIDLFHARSLPHRDNDSYFLFPPKCQDDGPRRYIEECFEQASPGAVLIADYTPGMVLTYASVVEGIRPDVEVITIWENVDRQWQAIEAQLGRRPVFVAAAEPADSEVSRRWYLFEDDLRARYEVIARPPLFEVVWRRPGGE